MPDDVADLGAHDRSNDQRAAPELDGAFDRFFEDFDAFLALEDRIAPFNLFEAVGMQRAEIRHSRFLAYILDPRRRHGLGVTFLSRFLYRALTDVGSRDPMPAEAMIADLEAAEVERERENIDILITVEAERLVVAIENKIDAGETGDQLARYHDWVENAFPDGWRKVYVFLSPTGKEPSHGQWTALGYGTVVEALRWTLEAQAATVSEDVVLALRHYREMLERTVLDEDRNREIARKLYQKHREVFDFVFASLPQASDVIRASCIEVLRERDDTHIISDRSFKSVAWLGRPIIGERSGAAARAVYFEIWAAAETRLILYLGPAEEAFRERLYALAGTGGEPFAPPQSLSTQWTPLLRQNLLTKAETASLSIEQAAPLAAERLTRFLDESLAKIDAVVMMAADVGKP